jgi:hypothetical protein
MKNVLPSGTCFTDYFDKRGNFLRTMPGTEQYQIGAKSYRCCDVTTGSTMSEGTYEVI